MATDRPAPLRLVPPWQGSRLSADDQAAINRARDRAQAGRHESVEQERAAVARLREGTAQDRARRGRTGRGA